MLSYTIHIPNPNNRNANPNPKRSPDVTLSASPLFAAEDAVSVWFEWIYTLGLELGLDLGLEIT